MKPLRILQCVSMLDLGGAERVAWSIASGLNDEFSFGIHAIRGTANTPFGKNLEAEILAKGITLTSGAPIPMRRGGVLAGAWSLLRAIETHQPDLIHVHTEIPESSYAAASLVSNRLRTIPCVRTVHNSKIWYFAPRLGAFCEHMLSSAACVGVSSSAIHALRASRATAMLEPAPYLERVITNGIQAPPARPARPINGRVRIVFGGRFEMEKGADLLPSIVSEVRIQHGVQVDLDLFGQGTFEPELRQLAANPPHGWRITIHPPAPDFVSRLAAYDVALLPSRFEGLSLFGIEAISAGLAVIATDAKGLMEVLPVDYPLRAPVGDFAAFAGRLTSYLAAPTTFTPAINAAETRAKDLFGIERMLAGYRNLYHSLLAAPPVL